MIVVELIKMLRRPRTWLIIGMLIALPTLVAVLLAITDLGPRPGTGPPFLSAVLSDGTLFPLAALGVVLPLLYDLERVEFGPPALSYPSVSALVELTRAKFQREDFVHPRDVHPLYLRLSDAEMNWVKQAR